MRQTLATAAFLLALTSCAAPPQHAAPVDVVTVAAPVAVPKRAVPAPVRTSPPETLPAPEAPPLPEPAPAAASVPPAAEVGVLTIPALGFKAVHTETIAPDAQGVVRPTTRDGLARVTADGLTAELWAVHSGGRAGGGPGGVLTAGDPAAFVGASATLPDGTAAAVIDAWVSDKGTTVARLDAVLRDPTAVVLVTCQVQAAARSTANVVVVLRRV